MSTSILLVDDEPDAGELFRQQFRQDIKNGTLVLIFKTSAEEALIELEENANTASVIFSDIKMPGLDGLAFLDIVKERWPALPIFMISAFSDGEMEDIARQKGADGFYAKPIDFQGLGEVLKTNFGHGEL